MKKITKLQAKKALSLFLAVLMLMSCWSCIILGKANVALASDVSYNTYNVEINFTISKNDYNAGNLRYKTLGNDNYIIAINSFTSEGCNKVGTYTKCFTTTALPTFILIEAVGGDNAFPFVTRPRMVVNWVKINGNQVWINEGFEGTNKLEIELTSVNDNPKTTPTGYDFYEDSYSFGNYNSIIPYGYFKTMYNDGKAWALTKEEWYQGGVCFGMTYTTASLYNGLPSGHTIRNLSGNSVLSIGNYGLTLETFIDYAHIYQFSQEYNSGNVWTDGRTIYNLVKEYLKSDNIGVTIGMTRKDKTGGHRVLAVGIDGNDILIDDPNNTDDYERLTVNSDGTWSFSGLNGWDSNTCFIRYNLDYYGPYKFISTMNPLHVNDNFIDNSTIDQIAQNSTSEYLSSDSILLKIDSDEYNLENSNATKVELQYDNETDLIKAPEFYWIDEEKVITISDIDDKDSEIEVAGNENVITVKLDNSSEIKISLDEEENIMQTNFNIIEGSDFEIQNTSFDNDSKPLTLSVSGTASSDEIIATKAEDGILVNGISDGTVTLSKDDEIIATEEIVDSNGEIEVVYDAEGDSEDLEINYDTEEETTSESDEPTTDEPSTDEPTKEPDISDDDSCSHLCHKNGFMGFIWKIVNFFCKIFKTNKYCSCGVAHY